MVTATLEDAVSAFGRAAGARLSSAAATGEPEDQLRGPFEALLQQLAALCGLQSGRVVAVGETSIAALRTRPDYAVTVDGALVGFIELKAPGRGGDPRRFRGGHDKAQGQKLQSLPNLFCTDGNEFSLWRSGELAVGGVVRLQGDVETSGTALAPGPGLLALFEHFLHWQPIPATCAVSTPTWPRPACACR